MDENQQALVAQFAAVTGASPESGHNLLASTNWNLEEAISLYYAAQDDQAEPEDDDDNYDYDSDTPAQAPPPPAARPTPAQPAAQPTASSSARKPPTQRPKQMTMDDLRKRAEDGSDHDSDHDKKQDMFAGGEKSGLAVQNPGQSSSSGGPTDHFKNIMNQARQNRDRPDAAEGSEAQAAAPRSSNFTGRAQTLGGDDAESQVIEDPLSASRAQAAAASQRVTRTLHLWADGVSIDDGPLLRFDDPANQRIMAEINRGRAPLELLDVQPDQEVDLNLEPHQGENYVQPKKAWKPFAGQGNRLGSPTPGLGTSSSSTITSLAAQQPASGSGSGTAEPVVDDAQPVIRMRLRLGDGTTLNTRFNTTHTIGDVYAFVNASSPASMGRNYVLQTTLPSKDFTDKALVLGDIGDFKRGGVLMQKWV